MKALEPWIPLLQQLVWPIAIGIAVIIYKEQVDMVVQSVVEGRVVEVGLFKLGEGLKKTEIRNIGAGDFSMTAVEGDEVMVEKGGYHQLEELQRRIDAGELGRVTTLLIVPGKRYVASMLLDYVSKLGVRHIIFKNDIGFDGSMEASVFSGQLLNMREGTTLYYDDLRKFSGRATLSVQDTMKASQVLRAMKEARQDHIAVVQGSEFRYMVSKQDILTSVISSMLLQEEDDKRE